jgi:V/A-type H+-transporting ATPase subunit I
VLYIGCALVLAGPIITGKGLGKITGIFSSLYSHVTGYFGDILSYSRIMALMLAGSVIGSVFNTLGAFTGKIWFFIPIFLIGHCLNFALNLLGCYVHDMRLQCLEYFGKFYKDGGREFVPLGINSKYYNIVK